MIKGYNTIPMNNQIIIDTFIKDGKIIPARTNEPLSDIKLETDDNDLFETLLNKQGISQCWNLGYKIYRKI